MVSTDLGQTRVSKTLVTSAVVLHPTEGIVRHKKKVAKVDSFILNDKVVLPWLRTNLMESLKVELESNNRKPTDSSMQIRTATNFFKPLSYTRKVKVEPGKSSRLANKASRGNSIVVSPDNDLLFHSPFDVKMASKAVPVIEWAPVKSSFSLDSRKL